MKRVWCGGNYGAVIHCVLATLRDCGWPGGSQHEDMWGWSDWLQTQRYAKKVNFIVLQFCFFERDRFVLCFRLDKQFSPTTKLNQTILLAVFLKSVKDWCRAVGQPTPLLQPFNKPLAARYHLRQSFNCAGTLWLDTQVESIHIRK